ncbi:MAG TPA: ABC transporter permease [Terriglobales bacterium]|nr:ABC transporter permease [Terriglobales bacterium]
MSALRRVAGGVRALLHKGAGDRELDEELRSFAQHSADDKLRAGMDRPTAMRAARVEMGSMAAIKDDVRDTGWESTMESLGQDVRYGLRALRKSPGFAAVAVLTLALGIGANSAIFTVMNAVLLRPLPYGNHGRLMMLWGDNHATGSHRDYASMPTFEALRARSQTLAGVAAVSPQWTVILKDQAEPQRVTAYFVSPNFPQVLGVTPQLGRFFTPEENVPGREAAIVISHSFWQQQLQGDPNVLGRTLTFDIGPARVVGVMPAGFQYRDDVQLWVPLEANPILADSRRRTVVRFLTLVGAAKPGLGLDQVQREMSGIAAQLAAEHPDTNAGWGINVVSLRDEVSGKVKPALLVLLAAVGLVLLIACANVAGLLLTRAAARQREIAVRRALGAGRTRLLRQFITESVLLAFLGGGAGLLLAKWGMSLLQTLIPPSIASAGTARIDWQVLAFTAAISLLCGIGFGIAPALGMGANLHDSLRSAGRAAGSTLKSRLRSSLVIGEMALSVMLLVAAGLLIRSFFSLLEVDPGFRPDHLLTLQVMVPSGPEYDAKYAKPEQRVQAYREMFQRIESIPGVTAAGAATRLPMLGTLTTKLQVEGRNVPPGQEPEVEFRRASSGYFRTMGIPTLQGRTFNDSDRLNTATVMVINQEAAKRVWPGEDPIGKRVNWGGSWATVIGVVGDVRQFGLDAAAAPEVYISFDQGPPSNPLLVIRSASDPASLAAAVRAAIREQEPGMGIYGVETMESVVSATVAPRRVNTMLMATFAGLALLLAAVGVYGLLSYAVTQRTAEIGVRVALGAAQRDVFRLVMGSAGRLALLGLAIGIAGALAASRLLRSVLFGVSPADPLTFVIVPLVLIVVAFLASYLPARRAARIDPVVALRAE